MNTANNFFVGYHIRNHRRHALRSSDLSLETLERNMGTLMVALVGMMRTHEESALKSSRISLAWEAKRQRARDNREAMTDRCPAWLRIENGRYVEILERADLVREIFRRAIEGEGKRAIVGEFRRRGIAPWGRGRIWHESYVQKILQTEAAFGKFAPLKGREAPIVDYFPRTVSEETYWTAQAARANRRTSKNPVPPGKAVNIFSGLGRCACGAGMHYVDKGSRSAGPYLVCGAYRTGGPCESGSKWLYRKIVREIIYFACMEAEKRFYPNQVAQSALIDEQVAARERHDEATRRLAALTEAIAAGAGASLATAHAAADIELTKAKTALVIAETSARMLDPAEPFPEDMYCLLWTEVPPMEDPEWRRATAATLRRFLVTIQFRSAREVALIYRADPTTAAIIPFTKQECRMPGEIHVDTNAGWWDGRRDENGRATKQGSTGQHLGRSDMV